MFKTKKDNIEQNINLITLVPHRNINWKENENGKIVLLKPKFGNRKIQHFFSKWMKDIHYRIYLDEYGSFVWKLIDGDHSVEEIGEALHRKYEKNAEPVYERLGKFIQQLHRSKFITIRQ